MRILAPEDLTSVKPLVKKSYYKPRGLQRHKNVQALNPGALSVWQRCCVLPADETFHRAAAEDMAAALLNAQGEDLVVTGAPPEIDAAPGRNLFGPGALSDTALTYFIDLVAASAFGKPGKMKAPSPNLVPYLLGGMTIGATEKLARRACQLIGLEVPETDTLFKSLVLVGFGEASYHSDLIPVHRMNRSPEEPYEAYEARIMPLPGESRASYEKRMGAIVPGRTGANGLNIRQRLLYTAMPYGMTFAQALLSKPPYDGSLRERVMKYKLKVVARSNLLFQPENGEMPEKGFAAVKGERSLLEYLEEVRITDHTFNRAVHMVFDEPWKNLDLDGDLAHDVEVVVARQLILALIGNATRPVHMSGATLVGISVLTGISMAKWAEFALVDARRRGECFINADGLRDALELAQISNYGHLLECEDDMHSAILALEDLERYPGFASRLRKAKRPLWSTKPLEYYLKVWMIHQGELVTKYKYPAESIDR